MRLNFRHGIVRRQTDNVGNPTFLQKAAGGQYINLIVSPDPTIFTIAHFDQNYLFTENVSVTNAWGPFTGGQTVWLYWDVDFVTGQITRGHTLRDPVFQATAPTAPANDQHWFDTTTFVMKVRVGSLWQEKLRVFAAKYENGAVLVPFPIGSQVGISSGQHEAGYPLFDDADQPIQRFRKDRKGVFVHTAMPLASQWTRLANFKVEAAILQGIANENIPMFAAVGYVGPNRIGIARNTNPNVPAIGIAAEDMYTGEYRSFITQGYVQNELWNWDVSNTQPPGSPLFVGPTGQLQSAPPQAWSIQQVATVVDRKIIYININPIITYG